MLGPEWAPKAKGTIIEFTSEIAEPGAGLHKTLRKLVGFSIHVRELPCLALNAILQLSSSAHLPPCRTNHPPFPTFIAEATFTLQHLPWVRSASKCLSEENTVKQSRSAEEASEAELASGMCPSTVAVAYRLSLKANALRMKEAS